MEAELIIRAMRLYLNLTQGMVAEMLGITATAYARYEKEPGYIERDENYTEVCRILKLLQLDPKKYFQGEYDLNEAGYRAASRRRGGINKKLRRSLQQCCPVTCKKIDGTDN